MDRLARRRPARLAAALGVALLGSAPAAAETLDETLYAAILTRYTREVPDLARTRVDYAGLQRSPEWRRLLGNLGRTDPAGLATRPEQLAYWINVYNILAMDLVVKSYPVDGIKDIGSLWKPVWKREAGRIAGRPHTLHGIEHEILRPMGEPRIHGAIVCAALSCPALRREPWTASRLGQQLDDGVRRWLADREKGLAVDRATGTLRLSRIFDWFEEDFGSRDGVLAFVTAHAPTSERSWLERNASDADIAYFGYDWSLNDLARSPSGR